MQIEGISDYTTARNTTTIQGEHKSVGEHEISEMTTVGRKIPNGKASESEMKTTPTGEYRTNNEASEEHLKSALSVANQKIRMTNTRCEFEYHDSTKRVSIKVIDKSTEEVIREIPPEDALHMVEKMWELAGFIVDERR